MARSYLVGFAVVMPHSDSVALKAIRQAVGGAVKMTASPSNVKPVVMPPSSAGFLDTQGLVVVTGYQYHGNGGAGVDRDPVATLEKMAQASLLAGRAHSDRCLVAVAYCLGDSHKDGHVNMACGPRQQNLVLAKAKILESDEPNRPFMHKLLLAGLRQATDELLMDVFPQSRAAHLDSTFQEEPSPLSPRHRF